MQSPVHYVTSDGNDRETHYPIGMYLDRFTAPQQPGLLVLHAPGNVLVRTLDAGQSLLVAPESFVYSDIGVDIGLQVDHPHNAGWAWSRLGNRGTRYLWVRLTGPGRVAVTSACRREDPTHSISGLPRGTTEQRW